jgi:hypothetical protein
MGPLDLHPMDGEEERREEMLQQSENPLVEFRVTLGCYGVLSGEECRRECGISQLVAVKMGRGEEKKLERMKDR